MTENTGKWNVGSCNTGHNNTGGRNVGSWNVGSHNVRNYNTGHNNTGSRNVGSDNTGHNNTGSGNVGSWNAGSHNIGSWNTGSCNVGYFNTVTPIDILVFNKPCLIALWEQAEKPNWLYVSLTKWISDSNMTDKEKEANPSYVTTGGYLKVYPSLKHAYIEAWEKATKEDKELTFKLPNFDIDVFKEIFGFTPKIENTKIITIDGKDIEISEESFEALKKQLINE